MFGSVRVRGRRGILNRPAESRFLLFITRRHADGRTRSEGNNSRCEEKSVCIVRAESHTVLSEVDRASERHIGQSTSLTLENAR